LYSIFLRSYGYRWLEKINSTSLSFFWKSNFLYSAAGKRCFPATAATVSKRRSGAFGQKNSAQP